MYFFLNAALVSIKDFLKNIVKNFVMLRDIKKIKFES